MKNIQYLGNVVLALEAIPRDPIAKASIIKRNEKLVSKHQEKGSDISKPRCGQKRNPIANVSKIKTSKKLVSKYQKKGTDILKRRCGQKRNPIAKASSQGKGSDKLKQQCGQKRKHEECDEGIIEDEIVRPSTGRERFRRRTIRSGNENSSQQGKMDTHTFQCCFENLWENLSDEKKNSFAYLDCLWFSLYSKPDSKAKVLGWIKKKQIFSKKYVIVPIVQWKHWSLLILCHMGGDVLSETATPSILLLDSLGDTNPKRLEPGIRKFVWELYKTEERPESEHQIYQIPFRVPKVPQQKNGEECGYFVLYYINQFIERAPESFSISGGYPYFMKNDWFTQENLEGFRARLHLDRTDNLG